MLKDYIQYFPFIIFDRYQNRSKIAFFFSFDLFRRCSIYLPLLEGKFTGPRLLDYGFSTEKGDLDRKFQFFTQWRKDRFLIEN